MAALQIHNLSKSYDTHSALKKVELEIIKGESFGLIGLNGAGKTTLLKSILDMHNINTGEILLYNLAHTLKRARNNLAYLPEKFSPPDFMTGMEYLRYILDAHNLQYDLATLNEKVGRYCQQLDLSFLTLNDSVKSFSKGMSQKLGIIGALLSGKELLIMDEPMSGLDPKARYQFKNLVLELRQLKKTLLFCTHILTDVEQLCDRIGIMHQGQLRFVGSPQACIEQFSAKDLEQAFLTCVAE